MKYGKLSLFLTTSIALALSGCATTEKPANSVTVKFIPEGYVNPTGPINPAGVLEPATPISAFSSITDGNEASNAVDGDLTTRWSSNAPSSWLVLDYGHVQTFDAARLAFYKGNMRSSRFEVQLSEDGRSWVTVVANGVSSGVTESYERFPFESTKARYVKYVGKGNTHNNWNSVTEFSLVNCEVNTCLESEFILLDLAK